jgi:hypothetical protein
LRRATGRRSRGGLLIHAFDQFPYALECDVSRSADEQSPPASDNPESRKDVLVRKDSRRFPLLAMQHDLCLLD